MQECLLQSRRGPQSKGGLCGPVQGKLGGGVSPGVGNRQMLKGGGRSHTWPTSRVFHPGSRALLERESQNGGFEKPTGAPKRV